MLELRDICFTRDGKKILDHVSIKFEDECFVAITGPNGSGKSTLAKIIMGIVKPDEGQVLFNGKDITKWSIDKRARAGIAFAFQQPVKFKGITVYDLIKIASGRDMKKGEVCEVLSLVGLCANDYIDREVNQSLSGGELKRIEIATVLARKAKLNVFDEPEAGIDLWSFQNLIKVFEKMESEIQGTTIIISHQEKILRVADRIIMLNAGKVEQDNIGQADFDKVVYKKNCCKLEG